MGGVQAAALHPLGFQGDGEAVTLDTAAPAFCGQARGEPAATPTIRGSIESCNNFRRAGCVLAWWMIAGTCVLGLECFTDGFFGCWQNCRASEDGSPSFRARGVTFPLREGELGPFVAAMQACNLVDATTDDAIRRWSVDAWMFLVFTALNALAGTVPRPGCGRWSLAEAQAAGSIRRGVEARCHKDIEDSPCTEDAWRKDMSSRVVSYGGEEVSVCQELTLEQVLPALPPGEHGACVDALDWVGPRTRRFLLNPQELLLDPSKVKLPKMPGRVHMREKDKLEIAHELVKRDICAWIPLDKVYAIDGIPILNGLFGVSKSSTL